jgi:hypothetical protein
MENPIKLTVWAGEVTKSVIFPLVSHHTEYRNAITTYKNLGYYAGEKFSRIIHKIGWDSSLNEHNKAKEPGIVITFYNTRKL